VLSDGHAKVTGIEVLPLTDLSPKTPPGTKVLLPVGAPARLVEGILLLAPDTLTVVGGRVDALVERWELQQNLARERKMASNPDYIPFVPFSKVALLGDGPKSYVGGASA